MNASCAPSYRALTDAARSPILQPAAAGDAISPGFLLGGLQGGRPPPMRPRHVLQLLLLIESFATTSILTRLRRVRNQLLRKAFSERQQQLEWAFEPNL